MIQNPKSVSRKQAQLILLRLTETEVDLVMPPMQMN